MSARRTRSLSAQEWNERVQAYVASMSSLFESKLASNPQLFGQSIMMMDEFRGVLAKFVNSNIAVPFVLGIFDSSKQLTWTLCPKELPDSVDYAKTIKTLYPRDESISDVYSQLAQDKRLDNRSRFYLAVTQTYMALEQLEEMIETYEIVQDTAAQFLDEIERLASPAAAQKTRPSVPIKVEEKRGGVKPFRRPTLIDVFPRGWLSGFLGVEEAMSLESSLKRIECGGGGNCFFYELIASLVQLKTMLSSDMFPGYRANDSLRRILDMLSDSFEESPMEIKKAISLEMRRMIFNANYESQIFQTTIRDAIRTRITDSEIEIRDYEKSINYAAMYSKYRETLLDLTSWVNSPDLYTMTNILGVSFLICQYSESISGPQYTWARVRPENVRNVDQVPIVLMYNENATHYQQLVYDMQSVFSYESLPPLLRARFDAPGIWPKIEATIVALYE